MAEFLLDKLTVIRVSFEVHNLLWNQNVLHSIHNSLSLNFILGQLNAGPRGLRPELSNAGIVGSNPTQDMDVCVRLF
jgi:hypothetical protein